MSYSTIIFEAMKQSAHPVFHLTSDEAGIWSGSEMLCKWRGRPLTEAELILECQTHLTGYRLEETGQPNEWHLIPTVRTIRIN